MRRRGKGRREEVDGVEYVYEDDVSYDYGDDWQPYVSVKERQKKAEGVRDKLVAAGEKLAPVVIEGRDIAKNFWGKAWCRHFERHVNYENRLPRGRSYLRNGCLLHLEIEPGKARGLVQGSELYEIDVKIKPLARKKWLALVDGCAQEIDSAVSLLSGELSEAVMTRLTDPKDGLLPKPSAIKVGCTCPDYADFCKHIATVLYGIGARLDRDPQLFFVLRSLDSAELIKTAGDGFVEEAAQLAAHVDQAEIEALFGIELDLA